MHVTCILVKRESNVTIHSHLICLLFCRQLQRGVIWWQRRVGCLVLPVSLRKAALQLLANLQTETCK